MLGKPPSTACPALDAGRPAWPVPIIPSGYGGVACPPKEEEAHWRSFDRQPSTRLDFVLDSTTIRELPCVPNPQYFNFIRFDPVEDFVISYNFSKYITIICRFSNIGKYPNYSGSLFKKLL